MLQGKSLIELRGIAQSFGIADIFQKDDKQLRQAIEMKQQAITTPPRVEIPKPVYDARLMTEEPAKIGDKQEIKELLKPYLARGLHADFDEEMFYFSHGIKTDQGTLRQPMRTILRCAEAVLR